MHILKESVTESIVVPASRESTWSVAGNPQHLASSVPMLGRFNGPKSLREGSQLTEIHTILGWPQKFRGAITAFKAQELWAMTSAPVSVGPASLPHDVEYSFVRTQAGLASRSIALMRAGAFCDCLSAKPLSEYL